MQPTWPNPDGQQVRRFLEALGKPRGASRLRGFFPSGDPRKTEDRGRKDHGNTELIKQWQAEGRGVYIVINDGGDTDAEITSCRALFCEWDDRPLEWQVQAWQELGLPEPTMQVSTGGKSIHNYWVLSETLPPECWRDLQRRLLEHADADRSLKNPSRVMRLPGCWYMHPKNQPGELVEIVHESGQRYSAAELEACLPELASQQPTTAPAPRGLVQEQGVPLTQLLPRDLEQLAEQGAQEGSRNDNCFRLAAGALAIAEAAAAAGLQADGTPEQVLLAFASRCSPPLPEREALACLQSAESEQRSPDPGWPERLRYQLNKQARMRDELDQRAAFEAEGPSQVKAEPQQRPTPKQQSSASMTAAEKLADLRELAAQLQSDRVDFAERLPTLRHRAGVIGLTIRDPELQGLLAAARRRRLGVDGLLGPGAVLDMSPEPWAWHGLLLRGCLNLLVALPKQGKTSLLVSLIGAWHHGAQAFLNQQLIGPCPPVLLIGTDQGQADWGRMLQPAGLVDERGRILQPIVGLAHSGQPLHLDPEGIDLIAEQAQQHPGLLVVIDSLSACIAPLGLKEESPEIAMPVAELMEQLEPHGATVVLIHHASKGRAGDGASSASRGSTALPALASQILKLAPANPSNPRDNRRLLTTEGRGGSPQALVIERQDNSWVLHGGVDALEQERQQAEAISRLTDKQADVLEVLRDRWAEGQQQTTAADLVALLSLSGKDPQQAVLQTLKQLERKGLAQSTKQPGQFGRRGAYAFWPTTEMFPTPSRGALKKPLGYLGCLGSEALAHEDPDRAQQSDPCIHPISETTDTTETQIRSPAREGENISAVAPEQAVGSTTTTEWVRRALRELRLAPHPAVTPRVLTWLDQAPEKPACTRSAVIAAMTRLHKEGRSDSPKAA
jgi:hypothetical protein